MEAILICIVVVGLALALTGAMIRYIMGDIIRKEKRLLNEISVLKREIAELEKRAQ